MKWCLQRLLNRAEVELLRLKLRRSPDAHRRWSGWEVENPADPPPGRRCSCSSLLPPRAAHPACGVGAGAIFLLAWLLSAVAAQGQNPAMANLPTLTHVEQIRRMTIEEAGRGYPVHLRGVVTYYNFDAGDLFIQDSTAGIWVDPGQTKPALHHGEFVEVEGFSEVGDLAPEIVQAHFRSLGEAPMPTPQRPTSDELASGRLDSQWIELEGIVRSVAERDGGLVLNVSSGAFECRVFVLQYPSVPTDIVDSQVRIRGVFAGLYDPSSVRVIGFQVLTPSWSDVEVLGRRTQGLWSVPVRPIRWLLRLTPEGGFAHRVRVHGVVTYQQLGRFLCLRDSGGALLVNSTQPTSLKVGDLIDATGYPDIGAYTVVMRDAIMQRVGAGPAPEPVEVSAEELRAGRHHANLVRLSARLLNCTTRPGEKVLELQADGVTFRATLYTGTNSSPLGLLRVGSLLQLTGISIIEVDENHQANGFEILLRSPADVMVRELPSWWTLRRALLALGLLAVAVILALGWIAALRRRVRQQTETLRLKYERELALEEQYRDLFENANDLIQCVDPQGRLLHVNPAWRKTLGYSEAEVANLSLFDIVHPNHRENCRQLFERLMSGEKIERVDVEFVTKGGETVVLEGSSHCQLVDGKPAATQGIFRNVTERKRAEAQLADRLRFETLLADLSARFVNVPAEQLDDEIEDAQRRVGECLGVEASSLWQMSAETPSVIRLTHVHRRLGGPPLPERVNARGYFPWCYRQIVDLKAKVIAVSSLEELPTEAARDRETWHQLGVKSALVIVLSVGGGTPVGALSFNTMGAERTWSEEIVNRLRLVAEMLSSALARQRSDRALRESEERFRGLSNASLEGIMVHDQGLILDANMAFARLFGYERPEELIGKHGLDFIIAPESRVSIRERMQRQETGPLELTCVRKDGTAFAAETDSRPVAYLGHNASVVSCRDITERKRAEEALRQSEQFNREVISNAQEGVIVYDREFRYVLWNRYMEKLSGMPAAQVLGRIGFGLFPHLREQNREPLLRRALAGETVEAPDAPFYVPETGKSGWLSSTNSPHFGPGGEIIGVIGIIRDITERKKAEEALKESEARFRTVFENAGIGMGLVDMQGNSIETNLTTQRMLGYSGDELKQLSSRSTRIPRIGR